MCFGLRAFTPNPSALRPNESRIRPTRNDMEKKLRNYGMAGNCTSPLLREAQSLRPRCALAFGSGRLTQPMRQAPQLGACPNPAVVGAFSANCTTAVLRIA